jgi:hypothetical protein
MLICIIRLKIIRKKFSASCKKDKIKVLLHLISKALVSNYLMMLLIMELLMTGKEFFPVPLDFNKS